MYFIDFKESCWHRIGFKNEKDFKFAISLLGTENEDDIFDLMDYGEDLEDTHESLTPEDNNGQPTIEAYNDKGEIVWDNVNGFHTHKTLEENLRRFLDHCYEKEFNKVLVVKYIKDWFGYNLIESKEIVDKYEYETGNLFAKVKLGE